MAKKTTEENYLDRIPVRPSRIEWITDEEDGNVTLLVENRGLMNRIFQLLFFKPKVSRIHLDENGSFVWKEIDGMRTVADIGALVEAHFGEAAHPTYERLSQFFHILESYRFGEWKKNS